MQPLGNAGFKFANAMPTCPADEAQNGQICNVVADFALIARGALTTTTCGAVRRGAEVPRAPEYHRFPILICCSNNVFRRRARDRP